MKIMEINAENFRNFEQLSLPLDGKSTIIYGINGTGKTTILNILNYLFWPLLVTFYKTQGSSYKSLSEKDVRIGTRSANISTEISHGQQIYSLQRSFTLSEGSRFGHSNKEVSGYNNFSYELADANNENRSFPIFSYYGVSRTVSSVKIDPAAMEDDYPAASIKQAFDGSASFKNFFEWFRNREDYENEGKLSWGLEYGPVYEDRALASVRSAIKAMLGVDTVKISRLPLQMVVSKDNKILSVEQLSDGEKCTLALFGDIARRLSIANPRLKNPLEGEGIVLIDEIELHLHPSWERKILGKLHQVFPNVQFIVTTHSPQVLNSVNDEFCLVALDYDRSAGTTRASISGRMDGFDSNYILEEKMATPYQNDAYRKKIDDINDMVHKNRFTDAMALLDEIKSINGGNGADYIALEDTIRREKYLHEKNH